MMYFWTAVDKLHPGFLEGDRLEALFMYYYIGSSLADWAAWSWVFAVAAWIVVIVEFALTFFPAVSGGPGNFLCYPDWPCTSAFI